MALLTFNAATVAPSQGFEPIPADWYVAKIVKSEIKPTKDGMGKRLNLQFQIQGGEYNNRIVFFGLNIENKSEEAKRISMENLSAICHAINVMNVTQSEQLHGIPMRIKVSVRPARDGYEASNDIKAWENVNGKQATVAGGVNGAPKPTAPAAKPSAPAPTAKAPAAGPKPNGPVAAKPTGPVAGGKTPAQLAAEKAKAAADAAAAAQAAADAEAAALAEAEANDVAAEDEQPWESAEQEENTSVEDGEAAPWDQE